MARSNGRTDIIDAIDAWHDAHPPRTTIGTERRRGYGPSSTYGSDYGGSFGGSF